jgi:hypothetical protein
MSKAHPLYNTWCMIKQRCTNPKHPAYNLYGGRGIKMCETWTNSFESFCEDVGQRPSPKHTIDRYPNKNGHYEPGNIRWATWAEQNSNRNDYAIITIRYKKNMSYAAYRRKYWISEKFDLNDLLRDLKEDYPNAKIIYK